MKDKPLSQNPGAVKVRNWRHNMTPEQRAAHLAKRQQRFASKGVDEQRAYRASHPGLTAKQQYVWYHRNVERGRASQKEYRARVKEATFDHYGRSCVCCGENELVFLTLDHVSPIYRKKRTRQGSALYVNLKRAGFPDGFQVLCFNCNAAKRTMSECPHKRLYLKLVTTKKHE